MTNQFQAMASLNWFSAYVARAALAILKGIINGIKDGPGKRALLLSFTPAENVITVLSDGNPRNDEQVAEVVNQFVSTDVPRFADMELVTLADKIQDEETKNFVLAGGDTLIDILRLLTDTDKDDKGQIKALLIEAGQDKEKRRAAILFAIDLAKEIKNEKTRDLLIGLLMGALEGGIG